MYSIKSILAETAHRIWAYPKQRFSYYQEWNRALFLHWKVDAKALGAALPSDLNLDLFEGEAWVSLVAFTMERIRPRGLPAVSWISNFDEINLRTYVVRDGKPGVYFLNIEAGKRLSAGIARFLSGLPYAYAHMQRNHRDRFQSRFDLKGYFFKARYQVGEMQEEKSPLDLFLTERYCLYQQQNKQCFRYEIQHLPWQIHTVHVPELDLYYRIGDLELSSRPDKCHYSPGVQVIAWAKEHL